MPQQPTFHPHGTFDASALRADGTRGKAILPSKVEPQMGFNPDAPEIDPDIDIEELDFSF